MPNNRKSLSITQSQKTNRVATIKGQGSLQPLAYNYISDNIVAKPRFDFNKIISTLKHRKWTVLLPILFFSLLALLLTYLTEPTFRASATIEISRDSYDVVDFGKVASSNEADKEFYKTQYGLLTSKSLAQKVINELKLSVNQLTHTKNPDAVLKSTSLVDLFLSKLTVSPALGSRLVTVSFESPDPELASKITNTFIDKFIELNMHKKKNITSSSRTFLKNKVFEVKNKLEAAEARLNRYAANNHIIKFDEAETVKLKALTTMEAMLAVTEKEYIDAKADQQQSQSGANKNVLNNPVIQVLKQQKIKLLADYQEMLHTFKPTYPLMIELQKRIKKVTKELSQERNKILSSNTITANATFEASKEKVKKLRDKVKQSKNELMTIQDKAVKYNQLKRDVASYQDLYTTLLKRSNEVTVAVNVMDNNISIVSRATPPKQRFKPRRSFNILMGALLGLIIGFVIALYLEATGGRLRSEEELEQLIKLPILGRIPKIKLAAGKDTSLLLYSNKRSPLVEAFRTLRTNLSYAINNNPPNSILITGPTEGEGKSTTAINLACAYVLMGKRVLLIDADLRKPSIAKRIFKKPGKIGLSHYLSGQAELSDIIKSTPVPNLTMIPAGFSPTNPVELLSSNKMKKLINAGQQKFDVVIIDSAPIRDISDGLVLSKITDSTLLTVQLNKTRTSDMSHALIKLISINANLLGVIVTNTKQRYSRYAS